MALWLVPKLPFPRKRLPVPRDDISFTSSFPSLRNRATRKFETLLSRACVWNT